MSKFKPGDLALIVGADSQDNPNVGKAVELSEYVMPGQKFIGPSGKKYRNAGDAAMWSVVGDGVLARNLAEQWIDIGGMALVKECYLMPLLGDFQPEQEKAKEVEA